MARSNSFIREVKLHDVKGRVDYITSEKRQENLYATYKTVDDFYWDVLAQQNQYDFRKSGAKGTCIEARELVIMLPPSLIELDHEEVLKTIVDAFRKEHHTECCAALHHNKRKSNLHIHMIFSERDIKKELEKKVATRNRFYDENGKHRRTRKEICDENGNLRPGCFVVPKGSVYELNCFESKRDEYKSQDFLEKQKYLLTDVVNSLVTKENEKLKVFKQGGPYLATKKIGKNNPKEAEIIADNKLRQEWNALVDRAVVNGADEATLTDVKKDWISIPVKESIEKNGKEPGLFASIMQRAINHLRNLLEYMREVGTKSAEKRWRKGLL